MTYIFVFINSEPKGQFFKQSDNEFRPLYNTIVNSAVCDVSFVFKKSESSTIKSTVQPPRFWKYTILKIWLKIIVAQ